MKRCLAVGALILCPILAFSSGKTLNLEENTITFHATNEKDKTLLTQPLRSQDFPTQIVRVSGDVTNQQLSCDEVLGEIETIFIKKISPNYFIYNTYSSCSFDPKTKFARKYSINSYFDPNSDQAIEYLKNYLAEYNGRDLFGTPFKVESAQGVIVALNVISGMKGIKNENIFKLKRQDHNNFFYKTNYDLRYGFIADIYQRFYTNKPDVVLPFLEKWLFDSAGIIYQVTLEKSNYIELQPERIFLMQNPGDIFVSNLRLSFAHSCVKYENKRCL